MRFGVAPLLLLLAACPSHAGAPDSGPPAPLFVIDAGFLFGAAVAGYQVEGGDDAADWALWEQAGADPDAGVCPAVLACGRADQGPVFSQHFASDLQNAAEIGLNALRFSLEWERLEPVAPQGDGGAYDPEALAYYHALIADCVDAGLVPVATLSEGTLPAWLHNDTTEPGLWLGGWRGFAPQGEPPGAGARVVQQFARFAGDMAAEFGGEVRLWLTFDQPFHTAQASYVDGTFPPGELNHLRDLQAAVINLAYANGAAYDAIHARAPDGGVPLLVGSAHRVQLFESDGSDAGQQTANMLSYLGNQLLPNAFANGDLDTHFDRTIGHPGDSAGEGLALAALAGRTDFLGVSYRGPVLVVPGEVVDAEADAGSNGDGGPLMLPGRYGFAGVPDASFSAAPIAEPIDPSGLSAALVAMAQLYPATPLYVTELTLNENAEPDVERPAFLVGAVRAIQQAMAEGAPVRGLFYRSLVDGFEWQYGFAPRTGLWRVDFTDPQRPRAATQGAAALGAIAKARGVTPPIAARWPPP